MCSQAEVEQMEEEKHDGSMGLEGGRGREREESRGDGGNGGRRRGTTQ